jgi:uncharacterized protein YbjT (DUF2867 family)
MIFSSSGVNGIVFVITKSVLRFFSSTTFDMENLDSRPGDTTFVAVVAGATGATGRWIVCDLVNNPSCKSVIALTRSDIEALGDVFPSADPELVKCKLIVKKLDFNLLKERGEFTESFNPGPKVAFCALGSAPFSEDSDFVTPVAFGRACKAAGVESMFLVSAQGARAGSWIKYSDTIGRREDAFKALDFRRLGIYRSGMMDRQEKTRTKELIRHILPSFLVLSTKDIARVMVESAIRMKDGTFAFSHSEIKQIAASLY